MSGYLVAISISMGYLYHKWIGRPYPRFFLDYDNKLYLYNDGELPMYIYDPNIIGRITTIPATRSGYDAMKYIKKLDDDNYKFCYKNFLGFRTCKIINLNRIDRII